MKQGLLASDLQQLDSNVYYNLETVVSAGLSGSAHLRMIAMEKISNDFPAKHFLVSKYPLEKITKIFTRALSSTKPDEIVDALCYFPDVDKGGARFAALQHLNHSNKDVRLEAIAALGACGCEQDVQRLNHLVTGEGDSTIQATVYISLLALGYNPAEQQCRVLLPSNNNSTLIELIIGLSNLVDKYEFDLIATELEKLLVDSHSSEVKGEIKDFFLMRNRVIAGREIKESDITINSHQQLVLDYLSHTDKFIRFLALEKFGGGQKPNKNTMPKTRPNERVFDAIRQMSSDEYPDIRAEMVSVLGDWKNVKDIEFCAKSLNDKEEIVRLSALYALGEIGDVRALSYLHDYEENAKLPLERVRLLQSYIRLGQEQYFPEWLSFITHADAMVRSNIAGGIWSVFQEMWRDELVNKIKNAIVVETYSGVYQELQNALEYCSAGGAS